MNLTDLHERLMAAARARPPSADVPYLFEKRVMAHLRSLPAPDVWNQWARGLWQAAKPCVGIMFVLAAWTFLFAASNGAPDIFATDLETTLLAPVNAFEVPW